MAFNQPFTQPDSRYRRQNSHRRTLRPDRESMNYPRRLDTDCPHCAHRENGVQKVRRGGLSGETWNQRGAREGDGSGNGSRFSAALVGGKSTKRTRSKISGSDCYELLFVLRVVASLEHWYKMLGFDEQIDEAAVELRQGVATHP